MTLKLVLKRDYLLLPILSVMYSLTVKDVLPSTIYLISALLVSVYFFPIKLFLGSGLMESTNKKRIVVLLSHFIISNIIALSALQAYQTDLGLIRTGLAIYGLINVAFLLYFHFTESGSYYFFLACCAVILTFATIGF